MNGPPGYAVRVFDDAAAFQDRAGAWLLRREAEHNLMIGIVDQLKTGALHTAEPAYLATVEKGGDIVGCAFRTPPYKLGLTRLPADAIASLIDSVAARYDTLPAVMGDERAATEFAQQWAERTGCSAVRGMEHRIYELHAVTAPPRDAAGAPRRATTRDAAHVARWIDAFSAEAGTMTVNATGLARGRIQQRALYLWEHEGEPVSMAAWSGETPRGRRVGYVYTPPQHRGHGYATALVADLSRRILDDGCTFCFLYTDLANPTSNSIYQQIGYRPICDVTDWNFECT